MILVVDDHDDTRSALLRLLGYEGYPALAASSGPEALAMLQNIVPILIILDYDMYDMNGLQFLAEVRKADRLRDIPVVMFSADRDDITRHAARAAGVAAYVHKGSLDWIELRREVARLAGPGASPGGAPPQRDARA